MRTFHLMLVNILSTMDLPRQRVVPATVQNAKWLIRNMGIRNSSHPGYDAAITLLTQEFIELSDEENRAADSECVTLPNGECIAPVCKLHGSISAWRRK